MLIEHVSTALAEAIAWFTLLLIVVAFVAVGRVRDEEGDDGDD